MKKTSAFLFTFLLITNLVFGYSLPVPPNTVKENEQALDINNIPYTTQAYLSQLSLEEVSSFYKENLSQQGFVLVGEYEGHTLVFFNPGFKENLAILIENTPENKVSIKISSWQGELITAKQGADKLDLTKDAPGDDVPGVPRYPHSVRLSAVSFSGIKNASYNSQDAKEQILDFYKNNMPARGWKSPGTEGKAKEEIAKMFGDKSDIGQSGLLFFENKNNLCCIMVVEACCGKQGSTIGISLFKKPDRRDMDMEEED